MKAAVANKDPPITFEVGDRDISSLFDYGIDLKTKTLYLGDDDDISEVGLTSRVAAKTIKGLHLLDNSTTPGSITIILNLEGGDETQGLAIYDAIRSCTHPTIIKVFGQCMSMGAWILQAGSRRLMAPNSFLMIHAGALGMGLDHPEIIKSRVKAFEKSEILVENLLLHRIQERHPEFTRNKLQELLRFDTYLNPQEAIELGLADEIIEENAPVP